MDKNYIAIVFDGPPSHESGRFVEVNDSHGKSLDIGTWVSRGDGSWELRIAVDKLKDDNDMATDTSREAVEALIARMSHDELNEFADFPLAADTLAALLDERDELSRQLGREEMRSDGRAQRIRELETETVRLRAAEERAKTHYDNAIKWRDRAERAEAALEGSEQSRLAGEQKLAGVQAELAEANRSLQELAPLRDERIVAWEQVAKHPVFQLCYDEERPLIDSVLDRLSTLVAVEAERDNLESRLAMLLVELTDGRMSGTGYDVQTMVHEVEAAFNRAEESDRDDAWAAVVEARAERDKLAAKLDAVKAWAARDLERAQPKYGEYAEGLLVAQEVVRAILADTDEGSEQ